MKSKEKKVKNNEAEEIVSETPAAEEETTTAADTANRTARREPRFGAVSCVRMP